jgi:hypothetical protein
MTVILAWQSLAVSAGVDTRITQTVASFIYGVGYCNLGRWAWKAVLRERRYTPPHPASTFQAETPR